MTGFLGYHVGFILFPLMGFRIIVHSCYLASTTAETNTERMENSLGFFAGYEYFAVDFASAYIHVTARGLLAEVRCSCDMPSALSDSRR